MDSRETKIFLLSKGRGILRRSRGIFFVKTKGLISLARS
jgi:hypothetical protein